MLLKDVLENSTYNIYQELYAMAKVNTIPPTNNIFMITKDELETTIVYKQSCHLDHYIIEEKKGYRLIALNVAIPFNAPGFIATISTQIANNNIPVLVISTYSRDYFMVQDNHIDEVKIILKRLGLRSASDDNSEQ